MGVTCAFRPTLSRQLLLVQVKAHPSNTFLTTPQLSYPYHFSDTPQNFRNKNNKTDEPSSTQAYNMVTSTSLQSLSIWSHVCIQTYTLTSTLNPCTHKSHPSNNLPDHSTTRSPPTKISRPPLHIHDHSTTRSSCSITVF